MEREEALKLFALSEAYTDKDLRKTYLKLSKKYHPDVNKYEDFCVMKKEIYELLNDEMERKFERRRKKYGL